MTEFLQAYGVWIVAGLLLVLLVLGTRNRDHGEGNNGVRHPGPTTAEPTRTSAGGWAKDGRPDEAPPTKRGSGCC